MRIGFCGQSAEAAGWANEVRAIEARNDLRLSMEALHRLAVPCRPSMTTAPDHCTITDIPRSSDFEYHDSRAAIGESVCNGPTALGAGSRSVTSTFSLQSRKPAA